MDLGYMCVFCKKNFVVYHDQGHDKQHPCASPPARPPAVFFFQKKCLKI